MSKKTPTDHHHSSAVVRTEEGVKLKRLLAKWGEMAERSLASASRLKSLNEYGAASISHGKAIGLSTCVRDLAEALGEPLTKSEAPGGERLRTPTPHRERS